MTNDAAGLRQHGWFAPASRTQPDSTVTFAPPLALADVVVEAGDWSDSTGTAVFKFHGYGIVTGSYILRSTVFGIESTSVPLRAEPFEALSLMDFDGGASAGVRPLWRTDPEPQCVDPWQIREASCGIGIELALLLLPLTWLWRRRRL